MKILAMLLTVPLLISNTLVSEAGTPVAVSAELLGKKPGLTFTLDKLPKDEALRVIERELAAQAGVEIVRASDGTLVARKIVARK